MAGVPRTNLAAFSLSDGSLDFWDLAPSRAATVFALAAAEDGIYAAGLFRQLGGINRRGVAKLDPDFGSVLPWDIGAASLFPWRPFNRPATSFYIGGNSPPSEVPLVNVAALDANTGAVLPWSSTVNRWVRAGCGFGYRLWAAIFKR